jgi:hypothetical protein
MLALVSAIALGRTLVVRAGPLSLPYFWDEADVDVAGARWLADLDLDPTPGHFPDDWSRRRPPFRYLVAALAATPLHLTMGAVAPGLVGRHLAVAVVDALLRNASAWIGQENVDTVVDALGEPRTPRGRALRWVALETALVVGKLGSGQDLGYLAELRHRARTPVRRRAVSTGQRQRVALARAFMRRSGLLVLGEPTPALEAESEARMPGRLRGLARGRTASLGCTGSPRYGWPITAWSRTSAASWQTARKPS